MIFVECFPAGQGGPRDNGHDAGRQRSGELRHLRCVQPRFSRATRQPPVLPLGGGVLGVRHVGAGPSTDRQLPLLVVLRAPRSPAESISHQRYRDDVAARHHAVADAERQHSQKEATRTQTTILKRSDGPLTMYYVSLNDRCTAKAAATHRSASQQLNP